LGGWFRRLDGYDGDFLARGCDEASDVVRVAGENGGSLARGCRHYERIDDIRGSGDAEEPPGSLSGQAVSFGFPQGHHHAPCQEASELDLLRGAADLGDYRSGDQREHTHSETGLVLGPRAALVPVGGHEDGGIV
jgi:hypothetical protein